MSKKLEVQQLKEEVRSALNGVNQELKEIIKKYENLVPLDKIVVTVEANGTDELSSATSYIVDDAVADSGEYPALVEMAEQITDDDILLISSEEDDMLDQAAQIIKEKIIEENIAASQVKAIPVKLLNKDVTSALAYKNSNSTSVLFDPHPTKQ